jgi:hypothetical protein
MTLVGRAQLDHPALGAAGGSALHASIESIYTVIGNDLAARYNTAASIANSAVTTFTHNFGVQFADLKVLLYTGTHPNLTRVADPVASGWVIAATVGFEKTQIDVTAPSSGGPHTFAVITMQSRGAEKLADLDDINTTAPIDGQFLIYDTATSEWIPAYLKYKSETATIASNTLTPTTGANIQRITSGAADLQMVASPVAGKFYVLVNETGTDFLIKNDTGGTAANRIYTGTGVDLTLKNQAAISLLYNSGLSRWIVAGGSGGGGLATELQSSAFTATAGKHYLVDNSASAFTGTLPAGSAGTVIRFSDNSRVWASRNFTIAPASGETIDGLAANETLVCDVSGAFVQVMWNGTKWIVDTNGFAASISSGSLSGGQGLGKKNYIGNPNNATNWVTGGSSLTVTTETSSANIPNQITQSTALAFTRVSGTTGYGGFRFEMDRADYGKPFEVNIDQKSGFTTEGYQIQVFAGSVSGTYGTQLTVSNASLSGLTGSHIARVDMPGASTPFIEFRIVATGASGTAPFYANNIYFGPGLTSQSYAGGDWTSFSMSITSSGTSPTRGTVEFEQAFWKRSGPNMEIIWNYKQTALGSAGTGNYVFGLPSGYTIDSTKIALNHDVNLGSGYGYNGTTEYVLFPGPDAAGTGIILRVYNAINTIQGVGASNISFGNAVARIYFRASIPITQFAGNGVLNVGAGAQQEWASNSNSTNTATDTSSFSYGPAGSLIPNGATGTTYARTVRLQYAYQQGDDLVVQVDQGGGSWVDAHARGFPFLTQGTNSYGILLLPTVGSTDVVVQFRTGGYEPSNATFAGAGSPWSGIATWKWRLAKRNPSSPVGFGLAGTDGSSGLYMAGRAPGLVTGAAISAGNVGEVKYATLSNVTLSITATSYDAGSLIVGPGVWMVYGKVHLGVAGTTQTQLVVGISETSATLSNSYLTVDNSTGITNIRAIQSVPYYVNSSISNKTVYLVANCAFTGTAPATIASACILYAVRIA